MNEGTLIAVHTSKYDQDRARLTDLLLANQGLHLQIMTGADIRIETESMSADDEIMTLAIAVGIRGMMLEDLQSEVD